MRGEALKLLMKYAKYKKTRDGRHVWKCRLGLWCVEASTLKECEREALHYFWQYHSDGEYV